MLIELSDRTRDLLAQTLPLMEPRKYALIEDLGRYLRGTEGEANHDSELVATVLTDMLITQAGHIVRSGALLDLDETSLEHSHLGFQGRDYSRFGDALVPVIRDVLGPNVPREVAGAWGDVFWKIVRAAQARASDTYPAPRRMRPNVSSSALHPI